jgi:uncharacterized protein DUF1348
MMATATITARPPLPPFTRESAIQKVRMAEDGWNTRDPGKVALAYAIDSRWRNRSEFINGRTEIIAFLSRKWARELDYRLIKELWAFTGNRYASLTSGTMIRVIGIAPMAMRTGNSMTTGSWLHGSHRSMTFPFRNRTANIIGRLDAVRTTIQD